MLRVLGVMLLLQGCSSYDGNWTGKVGSYLSTFQISGESGFFCYSKGSLTKIEPITFIDNVIASKKGEQRISAIQYAREGVKGEQTNFVIGDDYFYRDDDLKMASAYCRKALSQ